MKKQFLMLAAVLMSGLTSAYAETVDISSLLTQTEGITITADNDATYPWTLTGDGWLKTTNKDASSKGTVTFTVVCAHHFKVSFDYVLDSYSSDKMQVEEHDGISTSENCSYSPAKTGTKTCYFSPGTHTLKVTYSKYNTNSTYGDNSIKIGNIIATDYTASSLMSTIDNSTPGSLDRELIAAKGNLTAVISLKVCGTMNAADWATIKNLNKLEYIDLSETDITAIPNQAFYNNTYPLYLRAIVWPAGLQSIGNAALFEARLAGNLTFPASLTTIGNEAFSRNNFITNVTLPAALATMGTNVFYNCTRLKTATFTNNPTAIRDYTFSQCSNLSVVSGVDAVENVGSYAFNNCNNLLTVGDMRPITVKSNAFYLCNKLNNIDFSRTTTIEGYGFNSCDSLQNANLPKITSIGEYAFSENKKFTSVVIGDKITEIKRNAFSNCSKLKSVTIGASVMSIENSAFRSSGIEAIYVNAPAPPAVNMSISSQLPFIGYSATLYVPDYATVEYKVHNYWKNFTNYAVNTNPLSDIVIARALQLGSTARIPNTPNMNINAGGSLVVNGSMAQTVGDFTALIRQSTPEYTGSIINNGSNMTSATSTVRYYLASQYSNDPTWWYAICMPFDVNVSEITTSNGAEFVVRYYDGASRAEGNAANWKDVDGNGTLAAGKGYIVCASKPCHIILPATAATHNNIFASTAITTTLDDNASANVADAGWNLVGNPYAAYYDISRMNFTAPITVWSPTNKTYTAYSVADDQLALYPLQAFFVQKPEAGNTIVFNTDGRQTTNVITSPATAKARGASERKLIELTLGNGENSDMTRIVVNTAETDGYNMETDAAKMMSYETTAQIYSMRQGVAYAINEGPQLDGVVALGTWTPASGTYTISLKRGDTEVELLDNGDAVAMPYTFFATAGSDESRFMLRIKKAPTSINSINAGTQGDGAIYDMQGRKVTTPVQHGIYIQNGKKIVK